MDRINNNEKIFFQDKNELDSNIVILESTFEKIINQSIIKVYDASGSYIFTGTIKAFCNFLSESSSLIDIYGFTDVECNNIAKFGPGNKNGFIDRNIIPGLLNKIENYICRSELINEEKINKNIDKIKELYLNIYIKHRNNISDETFSVSHGVYPWEEDIRKFELVSGKIGQHYDSHGINKSDQLSNLINILSNGINPAKEFYSAPFEIPNEIKKAMGAALGTSGGTAYKDGIAVIVSDYKKKLKVDGIKYVFINDVYSDLLDQFKICFPDYKIHLLSEQKNILNIV